MQCQVLNSHQASCTKSSVRNSNDYNIIFDVFFIKFNSDSSRTAIQSNNTKACDFLLQKINYVLKKNNN